ncbi:hypothetical protein PPUN12996_44070 [Pseudomonas putida]|uniref:universal stress protein n=1 Tax=Pseudomonas asiatica TaxID=2219225 RepID=UPI0015FAE601|nr:universal stress protein [Pseudomonas asiatica]MBA6112306.1 universal stress protein [Pseudomonas asiatica]GLO32348.1 hypothetical protein PPUN12996_44070 [Pseudomonas putida]
MHTTRNALVVLAQHQHDDLALTKAKQIADLTHAHLHLLLCAKPNGHSTYLKLMQEQLVQEGYHVSAQQAWHDNPCKTVFAVQQAEGCDLVIKQHRADSALKKALLTPEDWHLLRQCPSPVLMVKHANPWTERPILTAIDAGSDDLKHRVLQVGILSHGHDIAHLSHASLHMMSAYPYPMLSAADPIFQLKESILTFYHEQCQGYQDEFDIDDQHLHLAEGPADQLIPHVAHQLGAALTVLGSVARRGLSGVLLGNTAELVLDAMESDVLVLKPWDVIRELEALAAHH